ncbi:MAG: DNA polymerase III subunit gamma/tau [Candidatus Tantalella remota]|nr:DNA polymerase III subunit gamma/tau [Candidatus Tantalella remota]
MSYKVLSQKYRPQTFEDVIGQETVTRTLKNSVLRDRSANAYIFCGPRGVGKTSVARILSKTLNCEAPPEKSPCNKCDSCLEISQSNNIDVLEIDGASNNRVEEVRVLLENVQFSPSKSKYKIYIIDEVHMLSAGAFNALLKTLEEPPAHVKFIFATTEPHKVLPTIMSRCQRFDFKRIPPQLTFDSIIEISKKEKIDIDENAALLIARGADGSLRDGLVILDQMVSFSGEKIMPEDVVELLGMVHRDRIMGLSQAVIGSDPVGVINLLEEMIDDGKDPVFIVNNLVSHFRDIMVLNTTGAPTADMALSNDELAEIKAQAQQLSIEEILYILQNLLYCVTLMKGTVSTRAPLEITLVRLTRRGSIFSLPEIIEKLDKRSLAGDTTENSETSFALPPRQAAPRPAPVPEKDPPAAKPNVTASAPTENEPPVESESFEDTEENGDGNHDVIYPEASSPQVQWKAILSYIKSRKMSVHTYLHTAKPVQLTKDRIIIGFPQDHSFQKEAIEVDSNKRILEEAVSKVTGFSPIYEFTLLDVSEEDRQVEDRRTETQEKEKEKMKPVIEKAMDVFGGHVVRDVTGGE